MCLPDVSPASGLVLSSFMTGRERKSNEGLIICLDNETNQQAALLLSASTCSSMRNTRQFCLEQEGPRQWVRSQQQT